MNILKLVNVDKLIDYGLPLTGLAISLLTGVRKDQKQMILMKQQVAEEVAVQVEELKKLMNMN